MTAPLILLVGRDDGVVCPYYGVLHEGNLWLVTAWLINQNTQEATPERMIRVDASKAMPGEAGSKFDYVNILLPKAVIEGVSQETPGYEVRSLPDSPKVHRRDLKMLPAFP